MTTADYAPRERDHRNRCPVHGGPRPCPACRHTDPMPPGWMEQTKAAIEAGRARLATHDYDQEPELHDPEGTP